MRKKLLFSILLLFFLNLLSYFYLLNVSRMRKTYVFVPGSTALLYQKKELLFDDLQDFSFEDYFHVLSFHDYRYRFDFDESFLKLQLDQNNYLFNYEIKEKEVEVVETVVVKEVIKEVYVEKPKEQSAETKSDEEYEDDYFILHKDFCSFENGTDLNVIIQTLQSYVSTNQRVTVDYSALNPYQNGYYPVYFLTNDQKYEISVEIK